MLLWWSGSANIRIGLAQQETPFNVPHCVARYTTVGNQVPKRHVQDQVKESHKFISIVHLAISSSQTWIFIQFVSWLLFFHFFVLDFQMLNSQITTAQHMEREKAYDIVSE